jgi:AcrR family transcriptional regulator
MTEAPRAVTRSKRRTQADRTAASRIALIDSAITLLSQRGFAHATTAAIAQHAGVTTGALHHHFPAKEDLFLAVLDELAEQAVKLFRSLSDEARTRSTPSAANAQAIEAGRAHGIISSLWSLYGSKRYWAVWEINIGFRPNDALYQILLDHRVRTREQMQRAIAENTALHEDTRRALTVLLPFLLASMRGVFLDTFFTDHDAAFFDQQLAWLIQVFDRELLNATLSAAPVVRPV